MAAVAPIGESNFETVSDLLRRLGGVSPGRVRLQPKPGTATERDLREILKRKQGLFELVDGVLVEKVLGFEESVLGSLLGAQLFFFLKEHSLGKVVGAGAPFRFHRGLVRLPDVAFISWERYPRGKRRKFIVNLAPDLAVEILRTGQTTRELARKRDDYFEAGVRLVWSVDYRAKTVLVHTVTDSSTLLLEDDILDGGDVLPGFFLSLREFFAEAGREGPRDT